MANTFEIVIFADIDSLMLDGGIHRIFNGYHCLLAKTFPFAMYDSHIHNKVTVVAVLDARRDSNWIRNRLS